ncbi:MAG: tRNA (adenosine(37)-N6)-threonylcarbamoyltransferase complex dimerization subunit type 1 TsaB [Patescibacteria group bacterium]|jgi:tRNA threonylcarbamoyl adenosine modification protein YeaZ
MYLLINTTVNDHLLLGLADAKGRVVSWQGKEVGREQAEKLLPFLDQLLRAQKLKLKNLKGIIVVAGPGGFSSVRLGLALANTLGYSLKIPVIGLKSSQFPDLESLFQAGIKKLIGKKSFAFVQPFYGAPPRITKPIKR